jgi:AraC-like DNA-binding protein
MPYHEIGIISQPSFHKYYSSLLGYSSYCLIDFDSAIIQPYDHISELAILDCNVNPNHGFILLQQIKRNHPDIPVLFITAIGSEEIVRKAYRHGARDYFRRPFDELEFKEVVESLLLFKLGNKERRGTAEFNHGNGASPNKKLPARLLKALEFIENEFLNSDIYLDQVADEACLSKYHFIRLFKEHFGITPMQYLTKRRIERAIMIMADRKLTVASVAYQTGFNDIGEFNKQFKKFTGLTPTEYKTSRQ